MPQARTPEHLAGRGTTRVLRSKAITISVKIAHVMLGFGIVSLILSIVLSVYGNSSTLAFIGLGLTFWGALLWYITPSKQAPIELLAASSDTTLADIEKLIEYSHLTAKGIYLPPKNLKEFESSLIFIPANTRASAQRLPTSEEADGTKLYSKNPNGIFLTPPGLGLVKLLEKHLGTSFTKTDITTLQDRLPKLLVEDTEIAEDASMTVEGNVIIIEAKNHLLAEVCQETRKLKLHDLIGCVFSSALACMLAKATGKPISIDREEQSQDEKTTRIQYQTLEG